MLPHYVIFQFGNSNILNGGAGENRTHIHAGVKAQSTANIRLRLQFKKWSGR